MKNRLSSRLQQGRQKAKEKTTQGASKISGQSNVVAGGYILRPAQTRYGPRGARWRQLEYAQAAIGALFSGGLPPAHLNHSRLKDDVNAWLAQVPQWRASGYGRNGKLSRMTVIRALEMYREANR
jgi:hypothetical protein